MLSVFELLQLTLTMYRRNLGLYIGYSAWILIPSGAIYLLSTIFPQQQTFLLSIGQILLIILGVWVCIILTRLTADIIGKQKINTSSLSVWAWSLVSPVLWTTFLVGIIEIVGFVFLIIPGLICMVWYGFAEMEIVLNGKKGLEALRASRELSRGRFFAILWRLFAGPFLLVAGYAIVSSALICGIEFLTTGAITLYSDNPSIAAEMLGSITDALIIPLFVIYPTILYLDLKQLTSKKSS